MHILAAGSLRAVWQSLMACYQEKDVLCDFGPAGLLRERIEAGEPCDFFASANMTHPQALLDAGRAQSVAPFASNRLCLTVRAEVVREGDDWLSLLTRPDLRIGTSTAGCDPSGDYTNGRCRCTRPETGGGAGRRQGYLTASGRKSGC